ncbi:lysine transporter LysE [Burkholderia stabilis]|uniref:Lysine transporter LysE n=2 Tax=Burkholderia cepacia complex TaxID=87882 RepID=A0A1Y1BUK2_9BURK|nr:lysine transporter LysE [Burkholderia stabilis]
MRQLFHKRDGFANGDSIGVVIELAQRLAAQLSMGRRRAFANNLRTNPARFDMSVHAFFSANLLLAYTAYFIGTASPGPSNLAIMSVAANHGRKAALAFALGVISGSMFWATVAALGVSAALLAWSKLLVAIKIFGGLYLLWLAFKSGRTALSGTAAASPNAAGEQRLSRFYARGAMLHLTNPKAILVWVSIVALSSNGAGASHGAVVPGCVVIGCLVFGGYALVFSMDGARRLYVRGRRAMEACLAVVFGVAGIRLLASNV